MADAALAQPASGAPAQEQPAGDAQVQRPTAARRVVRTFTFDEPNNPNPVPDGWVRVQDQPGGIGAGSASKSGFPWFNLAEFDHTQGASGTSSVILPTKGGSTALRLEGGEIPIFPDADYTVSARVKTASLEHARAFLTARLLDQRLNPIEGSQVRSEPVLSAAGWTVVRIVVPGKFNNAAFMQIDLELLQPAQFSKPVDPSLARHMVRREDVSGSAWFDDVSVALVPRSTFEAASASGLFSGSDKPALVMTARDQGGDVLTGHIRVLDIDGGMVDEHTTRLDPSGKPFRWEPAIRRYGWYRAVLDIDASGVQVSRSERWISYLPASAAGKPRPGAAVGASSGGGGSIRSDDLARFGLIADTINERTLSDLPAFIDAARTRFVVIPAFDANVDQNHARESLNARMPAIDALLNRNQQVTFALSSVPPPLAGAMLLDSSDAIGLSTRDAMAWRPYLDPTIDVYGQRILRYQVGRFGDQNIVRQNAAPGLQNAERIISRLVPGPKMILPWRADHGLPSFERSANEPVDSGKPNSPSNVSSGPLLDGVTMQFPLGFAASAMRDLALVRDDQHARGNTMELTVVPECPEIEKFGAKARAIETAKRLAEFWAALAPTPQGVPPARFALNSPWAIVDQENDLLLQPAPEVAAVVHMSERLAGRRVIGPVPAPEGVRALLLVERSGTSQSLRAGEALSRACVIAWNESALPENAYVNVFTPHAGVEIADIFGNVRQVSQDASGIQTRIDLTDAPIFIEGVDAYLALLSASFKFTPQFLPATATQHEHRIELTNPWPVRITGQMQLRETEKTGQRR